LLNNGLSRILILDLNPQLIMNKPPKGNRAGTEPTYTPSFGLTSLLLALLGVAVFAHGELRAQTETNTWVIPAAGADADQAFGSASLTDANLRIQQIYASGEFPSNPLTITKLRWRPDFFYGTAFNATISSIQINMSTTPSKVDGLASSYALNVGADDTVVFSGSSVVSSQFAGPSGGPKEFDIIIPLTTPFTYDPSAGNFLLDIRNYSGSSASLLSGFGVPSDGVSRMAGNVNNSGGTRDTGGDIIQLVYSDSTNQPPPEPAGPTNCVYLPTLAETGDQAFGSATLRDTNLRIQQVYNANMFPTRVTEITHIYWRPDHFYGGPFSVTINHIQINLSTTGIMPDAMNGSYAANVGADDTMVFDGPITVSSSFLGPAAGPKEFDIGIPLTTPFFYNPEQGNLLLDIRNFSGSSAALLSGFGSPSDGVSRMAGNLNSGGGTRDTGGDAILLCSGSQPTPPQIQQQPSSVTVLVGADLTFTVAALGGEPLSYQWHLNGEALDGEVGTMLHLSNVQSSQEGSYSVTVSNEFGLVQSSPAVLTVVEPPDAPAIVGVTPSVAIPGQTIDVTGRKFSSVAGDNVVAFGAVPGEVLAAATNQLSVRVPEGATFGPISLAVGQQWASSPTAFLPTFSGFPYLGPSSFLDSVTWATPYPHSIVVADFDGDGHSDVAVTSYSDGGVQVFPHAGSGGMLHTNTFESPIFIHTGNNAFSVTIGDVNADGKPDLVVVNRLTDSNSSATDTVSVLVNTATAGELNSGSFAPKVDFPVGRTPIEAAVADMDQDGLADILVASFTPQTLGILKNVWQGGAMDGTSFNSPVEYAVPGRAHGVVVRDLNADGKPDVVVPNYVGGPLSVFENQAIPGIIDASTFSGRLDLPEGGNNAEVADLNGDGKPDLIVVNWQDSRLTVYENRSQGGSLNGDSFSGPLHLPPGGHPHKVRASDINGDQRADLVVVNESTDLARVLQNQSSGGILSTEDFVAAVDLPTGFNPGGLALADLNQDGRPEVITGNSYGNSLSVFENAVPFLGPPLIVEQPKDLVIFVSGEAMFEVVAAGVPPLTYQWIRDDVPLTDATNRVLLIEDAQVEDAGQYWVLVANGEGMLESTMASLLVLPEDACLPPPEGLVGWWQGEGHAADALTLNDGQEAGGVSYGEGHVGTAFELDGVSGHVRVPASASLDVGAGEGFTVEAWVRPTSNNPLPVVEWERDAYPNTGVHLYLSPSTPGQLFANLVDNQGSSHHISVLGVLTLDSYQHVALTYDRLSGTAALYHNGSMVATESLGDFTPHTSEDFIIGARPIVKSGSTFFFAGGIDEVSVYNRALNESEITLLYVSSTAGKCAEIPARILAQPSSVNVLEGGMANFSVTAAGTPPLTYQWYFENTEIEGATTPSLSIENVQTSDMGAYHVFVQNQFGSEASESAFLNIVEPLAVPEIFTVTPLSAAPGQSVHIGGRLFSDVAEENVVHFGATRAEVMTASSNLLSVVLPAGATPEPVTLILNGAWAASPLSFQPTFEGVPGLSESSFAPRQTLNSVFPHVVVIADLDGDGLSDLAASSYGSGGIYVFHNTDASGGLEAGTFAAPFFIPTGANAYSVLASDVNADGLLDLVVVNRPSDTMSGATDTVSVLRNVSTPGSLSPASFAPKVDVQPGRTPIEAAVGDLDQDGRPELLVACFGSQTLAVFQNLSVGSTIDASTFPTRVDYPLGGRGHAVVLRDLNGDRRPDVVVPNYLGGSVAIFENNCLPGIIDASSFRPRIDLAGGGNYATVADLNQDDRPDVVVVNWQDLRVSIFQNLNLGGPLSPASFGNRVDLPPGGKPHKVKAADMDGDGKVDLVVVNEGNNRARVLRNVQSGEALTTSSFVVGADLPTGVNPGGVAVGDLDLDGRPDIVTADSFGNTLSLFRNMVPIAGAPIIVQQPVDAWVNAGASASFSVEAGGIEPLTYQWYFEGQTVPDATNDVHHLETVALEDAGLYQVEVSNELGSALSREAELFVNPQPDCVPPPGGLISWWPGDGGAASLFGDYNGTLVGDMGFGPGKVVQAFLFDGQDDHVAIGYAPALDVGMGNGLTLETWIRPDQVTTMQPLLEWNDGLGGIGVHLWTGVELNTPGGGAGSLTANLVDTQGGSHQVGTPPGRLLAGEWQHVALTFDKASGQAKLFLNGELAAQQHLGLFIPDTSGDLYLGYRPSGPFADMHYAGAMDEVSLYGRALEAEEIQSIFETQSAGKCHTAQAPAILRQPTSQVVVMGGTAHFSVLASGTPPLSYQWFFAGQALTGQTGKELFLEDVQLSQAGLYAVAVTSPYGTASSAPAVLTVATAPIPPSIVSHPQSQTVALQGDVLFSVMVTGTGPFSYQWSHDGMVLSGETSSTLSLLNVQSSQAGAYQVEVSNVAGSVLSDEAVLDVDTDGLAPVIVVSPPSGLNLLAGSELVLAVQADGYQPLSYQWFFNGAVLPGETEASLTIEEIQPASGGLYAVIISNEYGSIISQGTLVNVEVDYTGGAVTFANRLGARVFDVDGLTPLPVSQGFLVQLYASPVGGTLEPIGAPAGIVVLPGIFVGGTRYISSVAAGDNADMQVRAWDSAFGQSYEECLANGGRVGVSGVWTQTTGGGIIPIPSLIGLESFQLDPASGVEPPLITLQPMDQTIALGETTVLEVDASGAGTLEYQWYRDSIEIASAAGPALILSTVESADAGAYQVVVRNTGGAVTSVVANVTVTVNQAFVLMSPPVLMEGQLALVPLTLVSDGNVGGFTAILRYNPDYLSDPVVHWNEDLLSSAFRQVNSAVLGELRMVMAMPGTAITAGTQLIAQVEFRARTVPGEASTSLSIEVVDLSDSNGELIPFGTDVVNGAAHIVGGGNTGDNNGNGYLDIGDATLLLRLLAQLDTVRSWDISRNDLNLNGILDVGDVIRMLAAIAEDPFIDPSLLQGGGAGGASPILGRAMLTPERIRGTNGQQITLSVQLSDISIPVAGLTLVLDYPADALRLIDTSSLQLGATFPPGTAAAWHVFPDDDFGNQSGRLSLAISRSTALLSVNGNLADITFQVESGADSQHLWPVTLSRVEVTRKGYELNTLQTFGMHFEGREPSAPELTLFGFNEQGEFQFNLSGDPGAIFQVDYSEDLDQWHSLTTIQATAESILVVDPSAGSATQRFYRALPLP